MASASTPVTLLRPVLTAFQLSPLLVLLETPLVV
jgi:hypothetical protein